MIQGKVGGPNSKICGCYFSTMGIFGQILLVGCSQKLWRAEEDASKGE